MRRIAIALCLSTLGCLLCCLAPVLLLLVGGATIGAAITEWRTCYRDPALLVAASVAGSSLALLGMRTWKVRAKARRRTAPSHRPAQNHEPPIACTLAPGDLKARLGELAELSRSTLADSRREDLTLHLRYFPEAEERVRQMVEKERRCCAFLTFEFEPQAHFVALNITAPEASREAIQDIYAQFEKNSENHTSDKS